jgi:hypothetical protein
METHQELPLQVRYGCSRDVGKESRSRQVVEYMSYEAHGARLYSKRASDLSRSTHAFPASFCFLLCGNSGVANAHQAMQDSMLGSSAEALYSSTTFGTQHYSIVMIRPRDTAASSG